MNNRKKENNERRAETLLPQGGQSTGEDAGPQTAYIFSDLRKSGDLLSARAQGKELSALLHALMGVA